MCAAPLSLDRVSSVFEPSFGVGSEEDEVKEGWCDGKEGKASGAKENGKLRLVEGRKWAEG